MLFKRSKRQAVRLDLNWSLSITLKPGELETAAAKLKGRAAASFREISAGGTISSAEREELQTSLLGALLATRLQRKK
jgi:hypothetical protein